MALHVTLMFIVIIVIILICRDGAHVTLVDHVLLHALHQLVVTVELVPTVRLITATFIDVAIIMVVSVIEVFSLQTWHLTAEDFKWTLALWMQAENRDAIPSCNQYSLLVKLKATFESIEFALTEGNEGRLVLEERLKCNASLPTRLIRIEEALLGVLVPVRLRSAAQISHPFSRCAASLQSSRVRCDH